jgi:hypothetical protein
VFFLMPFSEEFKDVYEAGIKPACIDAGAYCERVDEQIFVESILERLYNQIAKADIIVAEMTGRNPNVFYETGYAHALNKQVILLTQRSEDIPFDLKHYPHIVYESRIAFLKSQLEKRIRWCIENPKDSLSNVDINLEFSVNGIYLNGSIEVIPKFETIKYSNVEYIVFNIDLTLGIHNITNMVIDPHTYSISLISNEALEFRTREDRFESAELPNGQFILNLPQTKPIFPDGWQSIPISLYVKSNDSRDKSIDVTLRFYTTLGPKNYPFVLNLKESNAIKRW